MFSIDCPICQESNAIEPWREQCGENKVHHYFKCKKCKREWH